MKAKDLAEILLEYPDFEVYVAVNMVGSNYPMGIRDDKYTIDGLGDIGHSDHVIILSVEDDYRDILQ